MTPSVARRCVQKSTKLTRSVSDIHTATGVIMQDKSSVIAQISEAFSQRPYPGDDRIIDNYENLDSINVLRQFKGVRWQDVPARVIDYNYGSLPSFTTEAFCYYLPAYLVHSLQAIDSDSNVPLFTLHSLTFLRPELRAARRLMSHREREAVRAWLQVFAETDERKGYAEDAIDALGLFWRK